MTTGAEVYGTIGISGMYVSARSTARIRGLRSLVLMILKSCLHLLKWERSFVFSPFVPIGKLDALTF